MPETQSTLLVRPTLTPLHRAADAASEQVSQALLGMPVSELQSAVGWCRVRTPDGYDGWCEVGALVEAPGDWHGPWLEVEDLWAHFRGRNDFRLTPAATASISTRLPLLQAREGWTEALFPDGRRLWTESGRVRLLEDQALRPADAAAVCETAQRFLGVPYLWGGCSAFGLDCSGFAQLVLRLHGVQVRRDADQQSEQGLPISTPEAADLVFFGPDATSPRITHVGLMLDDVRFIHSAGGDRVRINRLDAEAYACRFRVARRFLPAAPPLR